MAKPKEKETNDKKKKEPAKGQQLELVPETEEVKNKRLASATKEYFSAKALLEALKIEHASEISAAKAAVTRWEKEMMRLTGVIESGQETVAPDQVGSIDGVEIETQPETIGDKKEVAV